MLPNPDSNMKNKLNLLRKLIRMYSLLKVKQIKNVAPAFCKKKKNDWNQSTCEIPLGQDPERNTTLSIHDPQFQNYQQDLPSSEKLLALYNH